MRLSICVILLFSVVVNLIIPVIAVTPLAAVTPPGEPASGPGARVMLTLRLRSIVMAKEIFSTGSSNLLVPSRNQHRL